MIFSRNSTKAGACLIFSLFWVALPANSWLIVLPNIGKSCLGSDFNSFNENRIIDIPEPIQGSPDSTFKKSSTKKIKTITWKKAGSIDGANAKSFASDVNGGFWLATNGVGGVYYSNDEGKSWMIKNKNLELLHVLHLEKIRDTLFSEIAENICIRIDKEKKQDIGIFFHYYFWSNDAGEWQKISDDRKKELSSELTNIQDTRSRKFSFYEFNPDYFALDCRSSDGSDSITLQAKFPFALDAFESNVRAVHDSTLIVFNRSGMYTYEDNSRAFVQRGIGGLHAPAIDRMIVSNGEWYAIVGKNSIWKKSQNDWLKVVDVYRDFGNYEYFNYDQKGLDP